MPQENISAARPGRRWLQFRLRTLLVVMIAACIPLAWLTMKRERTRRQRRAVVAIDNAGGNVWYLGTPKAVSPAVGVTAGGGRTLRYNVIPYDSQQRSGNFLAQVVEEATAGDVVAVDFDRRDTLFFAQQRTATFGIRINGQEIENDSADKWILHRRLDRYFFDTRLTDSGLAHLRPLTELRILHLGKTGVTFAGASAFEQNLPRSPIIR